MDGEIKVAVLDEHEIVRRGLVAALADDVRLRVTAPALSSRGGAGDVDIAVVSSEIARRRSFPCPIVVCSDDPERTDSTANGNEVVGVLDRSTLTGAQLRATVHAAAAGLRVNAHVNGAPVLEPRLKRVLELMADGYTTREIAELMSYSERTIKKLVTSLQHRFEARSRAHIVAQAIRRGVI